MPLRSGKIGLVEGSISVAFDDPNLVSSTGLLPALGLAESAGLRDLADEHLTVPIDKGANAGLKIACLVGGMVAGADSIDDMALLRHGGMGRVFMRAYASSTLGSFLRSFTFGHVRQLDASTTVEHPDSEVRRAGIPTRGRRSSRAAYAVRPSGSVESQ